MIVCWKVVTYGWEGYIKLTLDMRFSYSSGKRCSTLWITWLCVLEIPLRPTSLLSNGRLRGSTCLAVPIAHYPEVGRIFSCLSPALNNFILNMNHPEYYLFNSSPFQHPSVHTCTHTHHSLQLLQVAVWTVVSSISFLLIVILSFIDQNSHSLRSCSYFTVQLQFISGYL